MSDAVRLTNRCDRLVVSPGCAGTRSLASTPRTLREEDDVPVFEPHPTLGGGTPVLLNEIRSAPLRLRVGRIAQTEQFTKRFSSGWENPAHCTRCGVRALRSRRSLRSARQPALRKSPGNAGAGAVDRYAVESITFDSVALIRSPNPTATRTDVEGWRTAGARNDVNQRLKIREFLAGICISLCESLDQAPWDKLNRFLRGERTIFTRSYLALDSRKRMNNNQPSSV